MLSLAPDSIHQTNVSTARQGAQTLVRRLDHLSCHTPGAGATRHSSPPCAEARWQLSNISSVTSSPMLMRPPGGSTGLQIRGHLADIRFPCGRVPPAPRVDGHLHGLRHRWHSSVATPLSASCATATLASRLKLTRRSTAAGVLATAAGQAGERSAERGQAKSTVGLCQLPSTSSGLRTRGGDMGRV